MITDDPRLNSLVKEGKDGDIVIVGVPFHYSRKRVTGKGGEDNGPCCLRRFFPKVGPLVNPQYGISINQLNVSDYGNISAQAENQVVAPQKAITRISEQIYEIVKNNKLPFVFGGSKETSYGSALGFQQMFADSHHILIAGRPTLKRPFDGNKLNSDNLITLLQLSKNHNLTVFGMSDRYLPHEKSIQIFQNISYQQIRKNQVFQQRYMNTQGGSAFREVLKNNTNKKLQVSLSVEAIERFRGTRDVLSYGLTVEEMMEIFLWCGMCKEVKLIDICQFNPSIQDYESSLILVNLLYYFLMGWTKRPVQQNILAQ